MSEKRRPGTGSSPKTAGSQSVKGEGHLYLHTSHCMHFHFAQRQILFRRVHELNEQVSSSGVGNAPHSPSCCWENSDVVVTHLLGQRIRAHGWCGKCVCHADNEVVQTFCSGARCKKNTTFLVRTVFFANVMIILVFLNCLINTLKLR